MTLVIDRRSELGDGPGCHALVVGVSAYRHLANGAAPAAETFGLGQLKGPVPAARRLVTWLEDNGGRLDPPLATCRLLLSPLPEQTEHLEVAEAATLENLLAAASAWRSDASRRTSNSTLFFFSGHGFQQDKLPVLLCTDFLASDAGDHHRAVDVDSLWYGMAPTASRSQIAGTQLYFIDACRERLERLETLTDRSPTPAFPPELPIDDPRAAPIFYAAVPKSRAFSFKDGSGTLFGDALIYCLNHAAEQPLHGSFLGHWPVTIHSLARGLEDWVEKLEEDHGADQTFVLGGQNRQRPLFELPGPPDVAVRLSLSPNGSSQAAIEISDWMGSGSVFSQDPWLDHPRNERWPAGLYKLRCRFSPDAFLPVDEPRMILPVRQRLRVGDP